MDLDELRKAAAEAEATVKAITAKPGKAAAGKAADDPGGDQAQSRGSRPSRRPRTEELKAGGRRADQKDLGQGVCGWTHQPHDSPARR